MMCKSNVIKLLIGLTQKLT